MPTITVNNVVKEADGRVRIRFGKIETEFPSIEAARAFARDVLMDQNHLRAVAIALMMSRQPNLNNPSVFEGRSVVVDFSLPAWGTIV